MSTGWKVKKLAGVGVVCVAVLCVGNAAGADNPQVQTQTHKKSTKKKPPASALAIRTDRACPADSSGFDRGSAAAGELSRQPTYDRCAELNA